MVSVQVVITDRTPLMLWLARASITHVDVDEGNAVYRFRKLLCFDGSKSRLVDADPIPLNNFPEEDD